MAQGSQPAQVGSNAGLGVVAPKLKTYRVYVAQVNQTYVHVQAASREEARDKGYAKWRRDEAHSYVTDVEDA